GRREELPAANRDEVRIAGAGADEPCLAGRLRGGGLRGEGLLERALGLGVAPGVAVLRGGAGDEVLPEVPSRVRVRDRGADARAPAAGEPGEGADPGRDEALDQPLHVP